MVNGEGFGLGAVDPLAFAVMMRPTCNECGRKPTHGRVSELARKVTAKQQLELAEGIAWLGLAATDDPIAWVCTCGALGIFGDLEVGL